MLSLTGCNKLSLKQTVKNNMIMMKRSLLSLFLFCALGSQAQQANQWLELTPVKVGKPALSDMKDVNNKTFTDISLLNFSGINVETMIPEENKGELRSYNMGWRKAELNGDTVTATGNDKDFTLNYYAVYLFNDQWIKGDLHLDLFNNAEVYLDGSRKLSYTDSKKGQQNISCELVPGKHTLIIKTVTQGGKQFAVNFNIAKEFEQAKPEFTTSPKRGKDIYDVLNGMRINGTTVSPSGKYAIVSLAKTLDGKTNTITNICRIADKEVVYSFLGNQPGNLQWIPGKDQLSFLVKEGEGYSLHAYDIEKKQQNCLIKEDKQLKSCIWSPDMSYILYYVNEDYSDKNWELRKLAGIEDRQPYYRNRSWLCKYDFQTGMHTRLTWGNLSTYLMDISHDGRQVIFSTSHPDYIEFPYSKQSVYMLDMKNGQLDTLWKDRLFSISCTFSPDDKQLLVSGGPSAFGNTGENITKGQTVNQYDTQLYIYDLASQQVTPITRNFAPSINDAYWHNNGNIYMLVTEADYVYMYSYNNGKTERINCPGDIISDMSIPEKGNEMMYVASDVSYPARIYTLDLNSNKAAVWANPSKQQYENIVFGEVKDWDFNYKKGTVIDGRFYLPADFDPNKKYPLIVNYYGGTTPVGRNFGGRYPLNLYAANGYIVYVLQPSGTIGYGQEFSARHQNNWCKITGDEIIAATKAFIKEHPYVDATKVGCIGASYGGFTTMYLTTHSNIFTCAISHAGISSLDGYWGDGYWGYSYSTNATAHAFPWNRRDIFVDQSPLFSADKAHNPILLIHGTKDVNVPTAQSMQFYTALKLLGKEADMVFVKDADHHVVDYQQRILWNNTIMAWFAKYLKGQPAWWENIYKDKNL